MSYSHDIFKYQSATDFLNDHFHHKKSVYKSWTLADFANSLGSMPVTTLNMIMKGKRVPSAKLIARFTDYFNFNEEEAEYFAILFDKKRFEKRSQLFSILKDEALKKRKLGDTKVLSDDEFQSISNWQSFAIRQLLYVSPLPYDLKLIQSKLLLPIEAKELQATIQNLINLNLIQNRNNTLYFVGTSITTTHDVPSETIRNYHKQMIKIGSEVIDHIHVDKREFHSKTLALAEENLPKAKELIRKFSSDFSKLLVDGTPDSVYQMNIQLFPLIKPTEDEVSI